MGRDELDEDREESSDPPPQFSKLKDTFSEDRINPILKEIADIFKLEVRINSDSSDSNSDEEGPHWLAMWVCLLPLRSHSSGFLLTSRKRRKRLRRLSGLVLRSQSMPRLSKSLGRTLTTP